MSPCENGARSVPVSCTNVGSRIHPIRWPRWQVKLFRAYVYPGQGPCPDSAPLRVSKLDASALISLYLPRL